MSRHFDAIITNSEATGRSMRGYLHVRGFQRQPLFRVAFTGATTLRRVAGKMQLPDRPYFVMLGTIEPRKNHLLMLHLWARFAEEIPDPPLLVLVGARGWENEQIVDMLERSVRLRGLVIELNRMDDRELGPLLASARALLQPSFAEGFGLPVAEALSLGVPVLCSDLPALREVGVDVPEFLDPMSINAWREAVLAYASCPSSRRLHQLQRLDRWKAPTWQGHFRVVEDVLDALAAQTG